jgi:hypothetical protein
LEKALEKRSGKKTDPLLSDNRGELDDPGFAETGGGVVDNRPSESRKLLAGRDAEDIQILPVFGCKN